MAKQTYEAAHEAWQETRVKVSRLQGEHQKCLNEKNTMEEVVQARRRAMEDDQQRERQQFEADAKDELADLVKRTAEIRTDYDQSCKKLQGLHTRVQELLAAELQKDKGALNAGLNGD